MNKQHPYNVMRHAGWDAAPRDPVSIGSLILGSSLTAATTVAGYAVGAAFVGYLATTAITSLALGFLAPKTGLAGDSGTLVNMREPAAVQEYVYGRARKGGTITYIESRGDKNNFLHMIVVLAGHPVEEIGDIYINDEVVALDGSGFVTTPRWVDGGPRIRIIKHDGSQTTADPVLVSETSVTSSFIGRDLAYIYVRLEYNTDVFTGGIPTFTAIVKGRKVYDPRSGLTEWSANAALCIRDYITSDIGVSDTNVDDVYFSAAANDCDDAIPLAGGGTEPRYQINATIGSSSTTGQALQEMVGACNGTLYVSGGQWKMRAGVYEGSVKSLTLDDFRSEISLQTRMSRRDNFNRIVGKFRDASDDWIEADFPPIESTVFLAEDAGIENQLDLPLYMVTSSAQAQRVAKQVLFRSREQMTLTADFGLRAVDIEVGDIVDLTIPDYGWDAKEFEVASWKLMIGSSGGVRINMVLRETSEAAFAWDAEEQELISNNSNLLDYTDVPEIGLSVSDGLRVYNEKLLNVVSLNVTSSNENFIDYVQIEYKLSSDDTWREAGYGDVGLFQITDIQDGRYDFRARAINGFGNKGAWKVRSNYQVEGLSQPPADITGFAAEVNGDTVNLSWDAVPDLDLSYYTIRHATETTGATWSGAVTYVEKVSRPGTEVSVPAKAGTFLIKAVDKTGSQSTAAALAVVTSDEVTQRATFVTQTEQPTFDGVREGTAVVSNELRLGTSTLWDDLAGNVDDLVGEIDAAGIVYDQTFGTYYFSDHIARLVPETGFVTVDIKTRRFDTTDGLFDDLAGGMDTLSGLFDDLTGGADFGDTDAVAYVSTTTDDPDGSPTWSEWRRIRAANVYGRGLRFKIELYSDVVGVSPTISELSATANYAA